MTADLEVEDYPDYFTDLKQHVEKHWENDDAYRFDRLAGALFETQCPNCLLNVGAMVRNTDTPWLDVVCPACDHEWEERVT